MHQMVLLVTEKYPCEGRYYQDDGRKDCRSKASHFARSPHAEEKYYGPNEIELLLHADRPQVFHGPHGCAFRKIVEEKDRTDEIIPIECHAASDAQQYYHADIKVERRQDAKRAAKVKAGQANRAPFAVFLQQKAGN